MSCPVVALVAGVKMGSGKLVGLFQSRRQLDAADRARRFVFLPARAGEIAACDALDGEHLGAHDHHGAAAQFVRMFLNGLRIAVHVGRDKMVGDDVLEEIEPEQRQLGQNPALVRDAGGQHIVECGDPVGGNEEQVVAVQVVNVADLAAREQVEVLVVGLEEERDREYRGSLINLTGRKLSRILVAAGNLSTPSITRGQVGAAAAGRKTVDSFSISEKPLPVGRFAGSAMWKN